MAELRQNPTAALAEVEDGETYVVTRHRRPIAKLVPVEAEPLVVIPAKNPGATNLAALPPRRTYDEVEALLSEMKSEW